MLMFYAVVRILHSLSKWPRHIFVIRPLLSKRASGADFMPGIVGIDHLVLSVGDFAQSKAFYNKLLTFLGFKLKHEYDDMAGWSNGKTLFWIAAADAEGRRHKYRKGDIGFHHYAFEMASRRDVDALGAFLEDNGVNIVDPPGEYYGRDYYAVYFTDPDGMKLEAMIWGGAKQSAKKSPRKSARRRKTSKKKPRS
jgi:catechol 2,3-dioxygenase-like lactoylglutathione lyase family enzyme